MHFTYKCETFRILNMVYSLQMSVAEICLARQDFQWPHLILLTPISNSEKEKLMSDTIHLFLGFQNSKINTLGRFLYLSVLACIPRIVQLTILEWLL